MLTTVTVVNANTVNTFRLRDVIEASRFDCID